MLIKYWQGWINSDTLENKDFIPYWLRAVNQPENMQHEFVVFKIPKNKHGRFDSETIQEIEKFLQEKFK